MGRDKSIYVSMFLILDAFRIYVMSGFRPCAELVLVAYDSDVRVWMANRSGERRFPCS